MISKVHNFLLFKLYMFITKLTIKRLCSFFFKSEVTLILVVSNNLCGMYILAKNCSLSVGDTRRGGYQIIAISSAVASILQISEQ